MKSRLDRDFIKQFAKLPKPVQLVARKNYRLWKNDSAHSSLEFKPVHTRLPIYSIRVGIKYRAVGVVSEDGSAILWFFIGSHAHYDAVLREI